MGTLLLRCTHLQWLDESCNQAVTYLIHHESWWHIMGVAQGCCVFSGL